MNKNRYSGISFMSLLFLLFLGLKLTNYISWSWWWVTSPIWFLPAMIFSVITIMIFFVVILLTIKQLFELFSK